MAPSFVVIVNHALPATFAKLQRLGLCLLRPDAETVEADRHVFGVSDVVVHQHIADR